MLTAWSGFGCSANTVFETAVMGGYARRIQLSATPEVPTVVTLDTTVRGLRLWTSEAVGVRYALDHAPALAGTSMGTTVDFSEFQRGYTLLPGAWEPVTLPEDSLTHELQLVSAEPSVFVFVEALVEEE